MREEIRAAWLPLPSPPKLVFEIALGDDEETNQIWTFFCKQIEKDVWELRPNTELDQETYDVYFEHGIWDAWLADDLRAYFLGGMIIADINLQFRRPDSYWPSPLISGLGRPKNSLRSSLLSKKHLNLVASYIEHLVTWYGPSSHYLAQGIINRWRRVVPGNAEPYSTPIDRPILEERIWTESELAEFMAAVDTMPRPRESD